MKRKSAVVPDPEPATPLELARACGCPLGEPHLPTCPKLLVDYIIEEICE